MTVNKGLPCITSVSQYIHCRTEMSVEQKEKKRKSESPNQIVHFKQ